MTAEEMWKLSGQPGEFDAWSFGGEPDLLADLVLKGKKRATSSLYILYGLENEELPEADGCSVVLNSSGEAVCVIRTDRVSIVPFRNVTGDFVAMEGEGNLSIDHWRKVHEDFFKKELEPYGMSFDPGMDVVCEEFTMIYPDRDSELRFITLRDDPGLTDTAAEWFHEKWGVEKEAYLECMEAYVGGMTELGWYLCMDGDRIAGGLGVIPNDFHDRPDLAPNICALYTEPHCRCRGIAGKLLDMAVGDLRSKEITPVYLVTDHTGFYERYGWEFLCMVKEAFGTEMTRMYIHR